MCHLARLRLLHCACFFPEHTLESSNDYTIPLFISSKQFVFGNHLSSSDFFARARPGTLFNLGIQIINKYNLAALWWSSRILVKPCTNNPVDYSRHSIGSFFPVTYYVSVWFLAVKWNRLIRAHTRSTAFHKPSRSTLRCTCQAAHRKAKALINIINELWLTLCGGWLAFR